MPDVRAMNALMLARASLGERLRYELQRNGYDPSALDALPDPGECDCQLARAIRAYEANTEQLNLAEARPYGWRF